MTVDIDLEGTVAIVTGATGALGSATAQAYADAEASVIGVDVVTPAEDESQLDPATLDSFHEADLTNESAVEDVITNVIDRYGRIDHLANVAGTWMGGSRIEETDLAEFRRLFAINLETMFLTSKHALPHLRGTEGAIVSVSARSSLEGGTGDGPYRASKAGVRLLTETIAEEYTGNVRANAVMPSVIDTPMNREMMPDADHDRWVDPAEIADVMVWLCSDGATVTSGAAVPVYGDA